MATRKDGKTKIRRSISPRKREKHAPLNVYVKDDIYSWLPARVLSSNKTEAEVQIDLPPKWTSQTIISPNSTIAQLEGYQKVLDESGRRQSIRSKSLDKKRHERDSFPIQKRVVRFSDYAENELPLQNSLATSQRDMADLTHLHEAAILYNLKERHSSFRPYTRVGDIVIAMNPFTWIDELYSLERRKFYSEIILWNDRNKSHQFSRRRSSAGTSRRRSSVGTPSIMTTPDEFGFEDEIEIEDNEEETTKDKSFISEYKKLGHEPHVYETSSLAYRGLFRDQQNQTILVTGETGAGKTETVKIIMTHLANLGHHLDDNDEEGVSENSEDIVYSEDKEPDIITRVLKSNPVFEAFGNAKTLQNDNSSRFGKFTEMQFDLSDNFCHNETTPRGTSGSTDQVNTNLLSPVPPPLVGCACTTYLLEKGRVIGHSPGERNYHIFYQFLGGTDARFKKWVWKFLDDSADLELFSCLGDNSEYDLLKKSDKGDKTDNSTVDSIEWSKTLAALNTFGYEGERLRTLLRALCCVLQLSNIQFEVECFDDNRADGPTMICRKEELWKLEDILGITEGILQEVLTTRKMKVGNEMVKVKLKPTAAKESTDALAKEIYARLFQVLVTSMNDYTRGKLGTQNVEQEPRLNSNNDGESIESQSIMNPKENDDLGLICLLDIFGFENFKINRFEQFCINYANEHLQYKYVLDNFGRVKKEYEAEEIDLFDFRLIDNSPVIELLEHKMSGVLTTLNEECVRPKGNDESFVYKIKVVNSVSPNISSNKRRKQNKSFLLNDKCHQKTEFGIQHFAGAVKYDATKFVQSNTDQLPQDLIHCLATYSTNELIRDEFQKLVHSNTIVNPSDNIISSGKQKEPRIKTTVLQTFREQLNDLIQRISNTSTRYIRCIKPNDGMLPQYTDHRTTMRQLECAGLITAITISRETFPRKLKYSKVQSRYECLLISRKSGVSDIVRKTYQRLKMQQEEMTLEGKNNRSPNWYKKAAKSTNRYRKSVQYLMAELIPNDIIAPSANESNIYTSKKKKAFECGKTRVYFRAGVLEYLETIRLSYFNARVVQIQTWFRCLVSNNHHKQLKKATIFVQCRTRRLICVGQYRRWKLMAWKVYSSFRIYQARMILKILRFERASTRIQTLWRKYDCYRIYQLRRWSAIVVQTFLRNWKKRKLLAERLSIYAKEARMNNKLLGLKQVVATHHKNVNSNDSVHTIITEFTEDVTEYDEDGEDEYAVKRRTRNTAKSISEDVNEELLQNVESMFEYLRQEIKELRRANADLHDEMYLRELEKKELLSRAEAGEAAAAANSISVSMLTKQNQYLLEDEKQHRKTCAILKKEVRNAGIEKEQIITRLQLHHKQRLEESQHQIENLSSRLQKHHYLAKRELLSFQKHAKKLEEKRVIENMRLKEELKQTQESHHEYLAKLMDVLETTHQTREQETNRLSKKIISVKEEKDAQIQVLKMQLNNLKKKQHFGERGGRETTDTVIHNSSPPPSLLPSISTSNQVDFIRKQMQTNAGVRNQRSQKFNEVLNRLLPTLEADNIVQLVTTSRSLRRHRSQPNKVEEETMRMKKMANYLGDLYRLEEGSQSKIDEELLATMESYLANLQPDTTLKQLQEDYNTICQENKSLKEQTKIQSKCPRCEARDKRRMIRSRATTGLVVPIRVATPTNRSLDQGRRSISVPPQRSGNAKSIENNTQIRHNIESTKIPKATSSRSDNHLNRKTENNRSSTRSSSISSSDGRKKHDKLIQNEKKHGNLQKAATLMKEAAMPKRNNHSLFSRPSRSSRPSSRRSKSSSRISRSSAASHRR